MRTVTKLKTCDDDLPPYLLGSFSIDDGDGNDNATITNIHYTLCVEISVIKP